MSMEDYERQRRMLPWPKRLQYKIRLRMRLRHLAFMVRHPRMAAAQRNGTF